MEVNFQLLISQFALLLSAEKQFSDVLFESSALLSIRMT